MKLFGNLTGHSRMFHRIRLSNGFGDLRQDVGPFVAPLYAFKLKHVEVCLAVCPCSPFFIAQAEEPFRLEEEEKTPRPKLLFAGRHLGDAAHGGTVAQLSV